MRLCSTEATDEAERFRIDMESRPEETPLEAYEGVPVELYGEAILRGMGWKPGDPIGGSVKKYLSHSAVATRRVCQWLSCGCGSAVWFCCAVHSDPNISIRVVEPIEFVKRDHRLGLGATPKAPEVKKKKIIKPGESREPKPTMVVQRVCCC